MDRMVPQQSAITAVQRVLGIFPNLNPTLLRITSPQTPRYNCIAYAAGDMGRWWWPDPMGFGYWPPGSPRSENIIAFQKAFETIGYALSSGEELLNGHEKVAFFHLCGKPTHAARQLQNGLWTSKLGEDYDISHDLQGMEGDLYGEVALIMSRKL